MLMKYRFYRQSSTIMVKNGMIKSEAWNIFPCNFQRILVLIKVWGWNRNIFDFLLISPYFYCYTTFTNQWKIGVKILQLSMQSIIFHIGHLSIAYPLSEMTITVQLILKPNIDHENRISVASRLLFRDWTCIIQQ